MSRTPSVIAYDEKDSQKDVEVAQYPRGDDSQLELLGYKQEFKRDFSFVGLFALTSSELAVLPGVAGTIWCVFFSASSARRLAQTYYQVHHGLLVSSFEPFQRQGRGRT